MKSADQWEFRSAPLHIAFCVYSKINSESTQAKSGLHYVPVTLIHGQLCADQQVILLFLRFFFLWQNYPQQEDAYVKHARLTVCIVVFMQTYYEWHHEAEDV